MPKRVCEDRGWTQTQEKEKEKEKESFFFCFVVVAFIPSPPLGGGGLRVLFYPVPKPFSAPPFPEGTPILIPVLTSFRGGG